MLSRFMLGGALIAAVVLATVSLLLGVEKQEAGAAPDYDLAGTGGIHYEGVYGRPINPSNPVDRRIIAGLPARDRRLGHGEILYGAFISLTNPSTRPLQSADRIELRHDAGDVHHPLPLPSGNPYAYTPRVVPPRTQVPSQNSPADENLAAGGRLIVFRIPAREYSNGGAFELIIHDPLHPGRTRSLPI